jgi:hypothetical protein
MPHRLHALIRRQKAHAERVRVDQLLLQVQGRRDCLTEEVEKLERNITPAKLTPRTSSATLTKP